MPAGPNLRVPPSPELSLPTPLDSGTPGLRVTWVCGLDLSIFFLALPGLRGHQSEGWLPWEGVIFLVRPLLGLLWRCCLNVPTFVVGACLRTSVFGTSLLWEPPLCPATFYITRKSDCLRRGSPKDGTGAPCLWGSLFEGPIRLKLWSYLLPISLLPQGSPGISVIFAIISNWMQKQENPAVFC